ncbi:MAG: hypothetical protein ACM3S1_07480 [Hyphomicrobiales bacterium]
MIAWAVTAAILLAGLGLAQAAAPATATAWRTVTRAFIVAPMTLVLLTLMLSV